MNLFDQLVTQAMRGHDQSAPIRTVVEKELLHHDMHKIIFPQSQSSH